MEATFLLGLGWIGGLLARIAPAGIRWGWLWPLLVAAVGAGIAWGIQRRPNLARTWGVAGLLGLIAWGYLGLRVPVAGPMDISLRASTGGTVIAKVVTDPQTARSGRLRFWAEAQAWQQPDGTQDPNTGRLYVTMDPSVAAGQDLYPSQVLKLTGFLYAPQPARNPGGFNFQAFLAQRGSFAGVSARQVEIVDPGHPWGGWALRRRVRRSLVAALGPERGELLTSMVLGARAAELDFEVQDNFRQVGLAHVLAASGFHVSLLLGVVLAVVGQAKPRTQQISILGILTLYMFLTGFSPPVVRAALMGAASAVVLVDPNLQGRIRLQPAGVLLAVAVLLLIVNPNWIRDLSFQLSFMATLGLMVGIDPIQQRLQWLPPGLALPIAISVAAQIWTLPLQLYVFGRFSTYALVANLMTLPLIIVLCTAGFAVCGLALVSPAAGTLVAQPLGLLLTPLINIVAWIATWPLALIHTGSTSLGQCVLLYGTLLALVFWPIWRKYLDWWGTGAVAAAILAIPALWPQPLQLTALAANGSPVMVIQTPQDAIALNSGPDSVAEFDLIPFLRYRGVRQSQLRAIAATTDAERLEGWPRLLETFPGLESLATPASPVAAQQAMSSGDRLVVRDGIQFQALAADPLVLLMESPTGSRWLLLGDAGLSTQSRLANLAGLPTPVNGIWWSGEGLSRELLEAVRPQAGIYSGRNPDAIPSWFRELGIPAWAVAEHGAICWSEQRDPRPCLG